MAFNRDSRNKFVAELSFHQGVSLYCLDCSRKLLRFFDPATFEAYGRTLLHPTHVAYRGDAHSPSPSFLSHSKVVSKLLSYEKSYSEGFTRSYKESLTKNVVNYKRWIDRWSDFWSLARVMLFVKKYFIRYPNKRHSHKWMTRTHEWVSEKMISNRCKDNFSNVTLIESELEIFSRTKHYLSDSFGVSHCAYEWVIDELEIKRKWLNSLRILRTKVRDVSRQLLFHFSLRSSVPCNVGRSFRRW